MGSFSWESFVNCVSPHLVGHKKEEELTRRFETHLLPEMAGAEEYTSQEGPSAGTASLSLSLCIDP